MSCRRGKHDSHSHAVCTEFINQFKRIGGIAERFRHFSSYLVAYYSGEIDVAEWFVVAECISGYDHAGHPEEYDVRSGHKICCRIVIFEIFIFRIKNTVEK